LRPDPRDQGPGRSSPGVRFPFRAGPRLGCPRSGFASNRLRDPPRPSKPGIASPGVLAPSNALTPGAPFSLRRDLAASTKWVKVARPSPVPSSGFLPLSTVLAALAARTNPLRGPPSPCAPTLRGLVSCRSRPLESPYRAFPSRGAVPALAGLLLPCGFAFDRPTARHGPRCSRPLSPIAPTTRHGWPCGSPDWSSRDDGSLGSLGRRAWRVTALVCVARSRIGPGSPDSAAGTPASKPCSPRESVLATTRPWPGMVGRLGRCSPGPFPSKACSSIPRVRSSRERTWSGANPCPVRPRVLATWPLVFARLELWPWGLEPTVR